MLLQNMDHSVEPCDDFYKFACGGFEERVVIPDDRSGWSQFSVIDKELQQQLRALLEAPPAATEAKVFEKVRNVYKACMDEETIEKIGLEPLLEKLHSLGGWPVLEVSHALPCSTSPGPRATGGTRRASAGSTQPTHSGGTATAPTCS
jgi:hypothetical protein